MPDPNMYFELLFSVAGILAMAGWLILLASPLFPRWSDRIAGGFIPLLLSTGYVVLAVFSPSDGDGGFSSLDAVMTLFSHPSAMLAGWIHYLAFDLLIGAWICQTARHSVLTFWVVAPCLPLTFLFGPGGFIAFSIVRTIARPKAAWTWVK
jgi:hypothetical protein